MCVTVEYAVDNALEAAQHQWLTFCFIYKNKKIPFKVYFLYSLVLQLCSLEICC